MEQNDSEEKPTPGQPRQPYGLGAAGKRLWQTVWKTFDLNDEPHKVELLTQACRVTDVIATLENEASKSPLTVKGSMGQKVISPTLAEARQQRGMLATLLGKLDLPDTDEAIAERAERLANIRRRAAKGSSAVTVTVTP